MFAPVDPQFPFQKPWKEAFALFFSRIRLIMLWFVVIGALSFLALCASSLRHLSPVGQARSIMAATSLALLFGAIYHVLFLSLRRRFEAVKRKDELHELQILVDQILADRQKPKIPDVVVEPTPKKKTDRIILMVNSDYETQVVSARQALVKSFCEVLDSPRSSYRQNEREDVALMHSHGSFDPAL